MKGVMRSSVYDHSIMVMFGIKGIRVSPVEVKEIFFKFPRMNQTLIFYDWAATGNPGTAGFGFIGRSSDGGCLGAVSGGLGVAANYIA